MWLLWSCYTRVFTQKELYFSSPTFQVWKNLSLEILVFGKNQQHKSSFRKGKAHLKDGAAEWDPGTWKRLEARKETFQQKRSAFTSGVVKVQYPPKKKRKNNKKLKQCAIWVLPKIGVHQNGWFIMENPFKMDDLGGPLLFLETHT